MLDLLVWDDGSCVGDAPLPCPDVTHQESAISGPSGLRSPRRGDRPARLALHALA